MYFSLYGEDAIVNALLNPGERGTYVDVGANDPVKGSNSYRLYLRGWSGLAIDPNPRFAALFSARRPRDTFLAEGVSKEPMHLTLHQFEYDTMNTLSDQHAADLERQGFRRTGARPVRCRPLRDMIEHHLPGRQIDLLSVDCEGLDLDVLRSLDLDVHRPTVMIVEDADRFHAFQSGGGSSDLDAYLREKRYSPVAQTSYSAIYVANDWRGLSRLSPAFSEERVAAQAYALPREEPA